MNVIVVNFLCIKNMFSTYIPHWCLFTFPKKAIYLLCSLIPPAMDVSVSAPFRIKYYHPHN
jgi:hypothetical protein